MNLNETKKDLDPEEIKKELSFKANTLKNNGSPEEWIKIADWCQKVEIKKKLRGS